MKIVLILKIHHQHHHNKILYLLLFYQLLNMSNLRSENDILARTIITLKQEIDETREKLQKCVELLYNQLNITDSEGILTNWEWSGDKYVIPKNPSTEQS